MTPERWERLKTLFDEALEQAAGDRAEFVARACPDDAEVRAETIRLLAEPVLMDEGFLAPPGRETLLHRAAQTIAASPGYEGELLAGRYFVEREIGRGGSGVVYLAQDRQLHSRAVVVKFLHAAWDGHERVSLKFRQEIEALSRMNHPAVVGVLDAGVAPDGRSFLVMEYVDGVTLRSRLAEGPLPLDDVRQIAAALCEALEAAHAKGICHRDIKPENIMLAAGGAKLIDFGIAKVWNSGYDAKTETVTVIGTVRYVAPEQLMGGADAQSDIYALGVVCYEMLAGRTPFEPKTPFQLYEMQKAGKIAPLSRSRSALPRSAEHAVLRALSFRSEDRQASARQFAAEFLSTAKPRRFSRRSARFKRFLAPAVLAAALSGGALFLEDRGWIGSYDRVIGVSGGRDPDVFGFRPRLDLVEHVVRDAAGMGYDAIRLSTKDQGFYYRKLTHAQTYAAMRKGWSIEVNLCALHSAGTVGIDLSPAGWRFDLNVMAKESGTQVVYLVTQIEKGLDGPSYEIAGPKDAYHNYRLIFDPSVQAANLFVDGVERLHGYRGHREYVEGYGFTIGAVVYRSVGGEALFKKARFEINP